MTRSIIAFCLLFLAVAHAGTISMFNDQYEAEIYTDEEYVYVRMTTSYNGYAAIGFDADDMYQADTIAFFRKDDGTVTFDDYYFEEEEPPTLDTKLGGTNNWEEVEYQYQDDGFEITVKRPLDTGEDADYVFSNTNATIEVICSAHDSKLLSTIS